METMTLERDALPPVRFPGARLAQVSGRMVGGTEHNRWYELALYQHEHRHYVLAWRYRTLWHGENRHARVETWGTLDEAMRAFAEFDPLPWIDGDTPRLAHHPESRQEGHERGSLERQARLALQMGEQYAALVRALAQALRHG